jgi:hypothetical protein
MSSGSVCVSWCCTQKQMRFHTLCDKHRSIRGVIFRKASPTALRLSSLVVYRHGATLPLILPRKELLGVVRSKLNGGHVKGARDFDEPLPVQRPGKHSERRAQKERSVLVAHRAAGTRHPCVPSVGTQSPTLSNKASLSRLHRKSKVQSHNLTSYPLMSSHPEDYIPVPAWNGESSLTVTPYFCHAHCDRWEIHHWKKSLSCIWLLGYVFHKGWLES